MKCQSLFSGKNKTNVINLSSAVFVWRVVKKRLITSATAADDTLLSFKD